jgi:3-deoxy-D-manno-octulosonic-acid transferase
LIYFLYSALLAAGMLLSLPFWVYQMLRHGKYLAGFKERWGRVPERVRTASDEAPLAWIHAVSVGEVLAVVSLAEEMRRRLPGIRLVVSTTTDTGQALARKRFGEENVFYFPADFALAIRPYLRVLKPRLVVMAETEFWPNFLRLAHASGASVAVVNARISDRSYPSYRRFRGLLRHVLSNVDLFLSQGEEDALRLREIGAESKRVRVAGNLKYDQTPSAVSPIVNELRIVLARDAAEPVLVCGSTVEGEEPLLLRSFGNILVQHARALMVLAPRHPERCGEVEILLRQMKVAYVRRSKWNGQSLAGTVLLLDTIGELASIYGLADVAFVGGSLVAKGGHNIIEPAQHGVAIVVGNHTENFRDIVNLFRSRNAVTIVGPAELPLELLALLGNESKRRDLGKRAAETMITQTGAARRTAEALAKFFPGIASGEEFIHGAKPTTP